MQITEYVISDRSCRLALSPVERQEGPHSTVAGSSPSAVASLCAGVAGGGTVRSQGWADVVERSTELIDLPGLEPVGVVSSVLIFSRTVLGRANFEALSARGCCPDRPDPSIDT
jgi:hypothetical protein